MKRLSLAVVIIASCACGLIKADNGNQFPNLPEPSVSFFRKIPSNVIPKDKEETLNKFSNFASLFPSPTTTSRCPKGLISTGSRCLWINKTPLSWADAQTLCNHYGLRLLEVRSGDYYVDVVKALKKQKGRRENYWIGASKRMGSWGWNTKYRNSPVPFWAVAFINGKSLAEANDDKKHCAFLEGDVWYFLNADHCDSEKQFICEKLTAQNPIPSIEEHPEEEEIDEPSCEEGWNGFERSCYKVIKAQQPYFQAKRICRNLNATLVSVNDTIENDWVYALALKTLNREYWIGLSRKVGDEFEWDDGTKLKFSNWNDYEPNNVHHSEDCVQVETTAEHKWSDVFCGNYNSFICEREATTD